MKAIVLAGGFATRLWPLTKNRSKCLLPIAGRPMVDYVAERLCEIEEIDEIYVSTNEKFAASFQEPRDDARTKTDKKIKIVVEPTMKEEEKLGAIGGLDFILKGERIDGCCLVVAGDNLTGLNLGNLSSSSSKNRPLWLLFMISAILKRRNYLESSR